MNLLLTSAGITNTTIKDALLRLVGKEPRDITIAFIPTGANAEEDKSWVQEDIDNIKNTGIINIHTVDISDMKREEWLPILEKADVIWLNGGNTYHLLDWVRRSGLKEELPSLLEERVYVGSSAGSIIVGPDLAVNSLFPEEEARRLDDITGLAYVPFTVMPHLNSPHFAEPTLEAVERFAKTVTYPVYAIDDDSAVLVIGEKIEVISDGEYKLFNSTDPTA